MSLSGKLSRSQLRASAISALIIGFASNAIAQDSTERVIVDVRIAASPLGDALRAFSLQSGVPVIFSERQVEGLQAAAVSGPSTSDEALLAILEGTGLQAVRGQGGAYVLRAVSSPAAPENTFDGEDNSRLAERLPDAQESDDPSELRAETVIVTGTSLRGLAPESSPLQVYTRDDIFGSGATTTEQFVRTLPQNFGGGSTEFSARGLPDDSNSQRNNTYATGANLRGLGTGATLTLVNGGRLAPTSTIGDFVDVSMIPVTAIDRIEVLTDGASSIYGGDAVAGVVNIVLRDDFDGAETALRYGTVTEGSLGEYRLSQALGRSWGSGNLIATYEYFDRDNLSLADRPGIGAPTLINGNPITVGDRLDLLPEQERHSLVLSGSQSVSERLKLSSTAIYSDRRVAISTVGIANTTSVARNKIGSEIWSATVVADLEISPRWNLKLDGGYSEVSNDQDQLIVLPAVGTPVRSETSSSLSSIGLVANTILFELPAGDVQAAFGGQFRKEDFASGSLGLPALRNGSRDVSALFGEVFLPIVGEENAVPGLQRLELNLSGRFDDYSDFGTTTNPKVGILWSPFSDFRLRSSWSTSFAPPKLGQSGALDRGVGVLPYDFIRSILNIPLPDLSLAGVNYLITSGTAANLRPETSEAFTAGFDLDFASDGHEFTVSGNAYNIHFENRLGVTPVPGNLNPNFAPGLEFASPGLFPPGTVIFFPDAAAINALLSSLNRPVTFAGGARAIENIGFINNVSLTRNLASTETSGVDLQVRYDTNADVGRLWAQLNASYILDFDRQASATTPVVESLNTLYNPVDLNLRAQVGLSRGGLTGSLSFSHVGDYQTDSTPAARSIRSWSTFDLGLTYKFEEDAMPVLRNTVFGVSILNLFDREPPKAPPQTAFAITGYDPANASPLGRFVALNLSRTF